MIECFLAIDFDGTIAEDDVTDAVLTKFAGDEWLEIEACWLKGDIGSKECLVRQMALVEADWEAVLSFIDGLAIDCKFAAFIQFVRMQGTAHAIISDGFAVFIRRILANAGIIGVPIFANYLTDENGVLKASFVNDAVGCPAGTCKCAVVERLKMNLPVVLIGDGRSDFCLADKADFVFAKDRLAEYCRERGIAHLEYRDFADVIDNLSRLTLSDMQQVG
ncbi:MAG: 2-hydroxy-3-keto-5-methylthiopentenyl-phosphate phosphatase related protein [Firmicutes bacterium]|nr:2-hydroxy-3-keto-5-methylthiopentenyl-phosphate phosphatase related protein [Bacillota bacterium]